VHAPSAFPLPIPAGPPIPNPNPGEGPSRPVVVTGAGGYIGRALLAELRRRGHPVRALLRRLPGSTALREDPGLQWLQVDLDDAAAVARAVEGAAAVIHLAFEVRRTRADQADLTQRVLRHLVAPLDAEARFVLVSSFSVYDWRQVGAVLQADSPLLAPHEQTPWYGDYAHLKRRQEHWAGQICAAAGVPLHVLRPSRVYDRERVPADLVGIGLGPLLLVPRARRQAHVIERQACAAAIADALAPEATAGVRLLTASPAPALLDWARPLLPHRRLLALPRPVEWPLRLLHPLAAWALRRGWPVPGLLLRHRYEARYTTARVGPLEG
jgi:nucleoside-diphosphate-sugar epimerase